MHFAWCRAHGNPTNRKYNFGQTPALPTWLASGLGHRSSRRSILKMQDKRKKRSCHSHSHVCHGSRTIALALGRVLPLDVLVLASLVPIDWKHLKKNPTMFRVTLQPLAALQLRPRQARERRAVAVAVAVAVDSTRRLLARALASSASVASPASPCQQTNPAGLPERAQAVVIGGGVIGCSILSVPFAPVHCSAITCCLAAASLLSRCCLTAVTQPHTHTHTCLCCLTAVSLPWSFL